MPSPSTHQDSPKVPEAAFQAFCAELTSRQGWTIATYKAADEINAALAKAMPHFFSALLSDEASAAFMRAAVARKGPVDTEAVRLGFQAAIEQVGGGQG